MTKEFFVFNMSFMYRMIVASAPLLGFAIPRAEGELRRYYIEHLGEECGHDVLLRQDLKGLGVIDVPRFHEAAQIAGSQYYLIAHEDPAALLGYMMVLERNSLSLERVEAAEKQFGVKLDCARHHAIHDPGHAEGLEKQIAALPPRLRELVQWNAENVLDFLMQVFVNAEVKYGLC